jgi:hypothetical protein
MLYLRSARQATANAGTASAARFEPCVEIQRAVGLEEVQHKGIVT